MSENIVNPKLTPRRRDVVENPAYRGFVRRVVAAYGRRVASGDIEALADMVTVASDMDTAIRTAVTGLRAAGYSWADIGRRLGCSKQAAQQRYTSNPEMEETS